jgi:hypothetical protein
VFIKFLVFLPELIEENRFYLFWIVAVFYWNVASDWLSLLIIRSWFLYAGHRPLLLLLGGAMFGIITITVCFFIRDFTIIAIQTIEVGGPIFDWSSVLAVGDWGRAFLRDVSNVLHLRIVVSAMPLFAAIAVHFWLLLLAISVVLLKALSWTLSAAGKTQWFIKQGQHHPLDAIGYVAAVIVFVTTGAAQLVWR